MTKQSIKKFFKHALIIFACLLPFVFILFLITTPGIDENTVGESMAKIFVLKYILIVFVWIPFILAVVGKYGGWVGFFIMPLIYVFVLSCLFLVIGKGVSWILHKK